MKQLFLLLAAAMIFSKINGQDSIGLKIDSLTVSMNPSGNSNPYALIAGGSKGIGYALAEALAKRKYNLVLIARGMDSLIAAKQKLESAYGIHVDILSYDLSLEQSQKEVADWCIQRDLPLKMLCNVAGFGGSKDYLSIPLEQTRYMIELNLEMPAAMTQLLLPLLEKNKPAYVLNVASMAAFAPIPIKNMYSASKAGVLYFSYALRYQLKDKDISVSCLAPGPVFTKPEIVKETKKQLGWLGMKMEVSPDRVGEIAIRKTLRGRMIIVPGTLASLMSGFLRVMPKRWSARMYHRVGKK